MTSEAYKVTEKKKEVWELEKIKGQLVPGVVYGDNQIIQHLIDDVKAGKEWNALRQIRNVAFLPGIQKASLAMPDVHPGYGFCIGGVGAFDSKEGVITVAGVGFDVNCGVRNLRLKMKKSELMKKQKEIAQALYEIIPAGLGSKGKIRLTQNEIDDVLVEGAEFSISRGFGIKEDLEYIEENGRIRGANPDAVSSLAKRRQFKQIGTLGSGNHYLEVQYVDEVFDEEAAKAFGLKKDQIIVSIHCGSRALGHQVGSDYLKYLADATRKYKIKIRDKELVCAPFKSPEGQRYFSAVNGAINTAFANREALVHLTRQAFKRVFKMKSDEIRTLYEIGHNTCKLEKHGNKRLVVHRKGATRAFGPGREEVPKKYRKVGQPVLIGGTMGTHSYILHGTETAMKETFGSACHGAGRTMSRKQALRQWRGEKVVNSLAKKGIIIKGHGWRGLAEEAPGAYKDVTEVVDVMHRTGIAKKVVKVKPLVVIKG